MARLFYLLSRFLFAFLLASAHARKHGSQQKPPILFGCLPHWSHNEKFLQIAEGLVKKGYPVTFMSSPLYKDRVQRIGATYFKIHDTPTTHGFLLSDEEMM